MSSVSAVTRPTRRDMVKHPWRSLAGLLLVALPVAALIMIVVAGAFGFSDIVMMKYIAFGMIFALLIDATIVRMLLVPAKFTKDATEEAIRAGIELVVIITEGVPVKDTAELFEARNPKNRAPIASVDGTVSLSDEGNFWTLTITPDDASTASRKPRCPNRRPE